jgi:hypothetical protein
MYDEICAVFPGARMREVIFTFGSVIYSPGGIKITPALLAHEQIHAERQGDNWGPWWKRYLIDPAFRLDEELPAHRAEYRAFCKRHGAPHARQTYLGLVAQRLASPLYGNLLSAALARDLIVRAA